MLRSLELRRGFVESGLSGATRSLGLSHNNLGLVYQDSGRFAEAKQALHDALVLRRSIDDVAGVAQTLSNLGTIHQDDGDHAGAGELFEEALIHARAVGDRMREAVILTNLGENHYRTGAPAKAIAELQKAEEVSGSLGDRILEGEILRGLAKAHMLIHDHAKAREYVSSSILLFEQARAKSFLATALRTRGEIAVSAGWGGEEHEKARAAFGKSIQIFEDLGNEIELASSLEAYAGLLVLDKSAASVEEAHTIQKRAEAIRARLRASDSTEIRLDDESGDDFDVASTLTS
jgi:tetratricopeptide (TPR) repeat protein